MKIAEPREIIEVRKKIIKELLSKYKFSELELAEYFCAPVACIRGDLKELGIEAPSEKSTLDIEKLTAQRNRKLKKALEVSENQSDILKSFGLWRMPKDLQNPSHKDEIVLVTEKNNLVTEENKKNMIKAMSLIELGFSIGDTCHHLGMDGINGTAISLLAQKDGLVGKNRIQTDRELLSYVDELLEERLADPNFKIKTDAMALSTNVSRLTGSGYRVVYDRAINMRNKVKNKDSTITPSPHGKPKSSSKMEKINAIYEKWVTGQYTQQELADEYKVTRATIMNYVKLAKVDRTDELAQNMPIVRRRNTSEKQREKNEKYRIEILKKYNELVKKGIEDPSINRISVETGINIRAVGRVLKQEGLISLLAYRCDLETLKECSQLAEESYSKGLMANFGYGPNVGVTKDKTLMKKFEKQSEINRALNMDKNLRQYYNQHSGSIMDYCIAHNENARKELENQEKSDVDLQEEELDME